MCHDNLCHADVLIQPRSEWWGSEKGRHLRDLCNFCESNVLETLLVLSEERLMPAFVQHQKNPHRGRVWETRIVISATCNNLVAMRPPQSILVLFGREVWGRARRVGGLKEKNKRLSNQIHTVVNPCSVILCVSLFLQLGEAGCSGDISRQEDVLQISSNTALE